MSWVRLDDRMWSDPKLMKLSAWAHRAWVRGLAYASAQRLDGRLPPVAMKVLRVSAKQQRELVEAGLWVATPDGVEIKNYLKYQPSRAELEARRKANAERVKRWRNGVTRSPPGSVSNPAPVPSRPVPSPTHPSGERSRARARVSYGDIRASDWPGPSPMAGHDKTARSVQANLELEHKRFVAFHEGEGTLRRAEQWDAKFTKWLLDSPNFKRKGAEDAPGLTEHQQRKRAAEKAKADPWEGM